MKNLTRGQRVGVVLTIVWVVAVAFFLAKDFPTEEGVFDNVYTQRREADLEAYREFIAQERRCNAIPLGAADLLSGPRWECLRAANKEKVESLQHSKTSFEDQLSKQMDGLSERQIQLIAMTILFCAGPPLLVFGAITWILRAPPGSNGSTTEQP